MPEPEREVRFHSERRWRFDLAWVDEKRGLKLAVEIDGGLYVYGGHNRGAQIEKDMEKAAEAVLAGWRLIRVGPNHIKSGAAAEWIERALTQPETSD